MNNQIIKVRIKSIVPYGAFCEILDDKYDSNYAGLIHISEISDYYVSNIKHFIEEGQEVECQIIDILDEKKQIKLSYKRIRDDLLKN